MEAARNLIPELESIARSCRSMHGLAGGALINVTNRVNQIIKKCDPVIHIITIGSKPARTSLAGQWKVFQQEWQQHSYDTAAGVADHCIRFLQAIADGG